MSLSGPGGFGNCGIFLAHNYVSEQFGNYVIYGTCFASLCFMYCHGMPFITKQIYAMHKYLLCVAVFHVSSWDAFYHQADIRHAQILALDRCVSCIVAVTEV